MADFKELLGKTLVFVYVRKNKGDDFIEFFCSDGSKYKMRHYRDCCEEVYIEDINGDINDIIGNPITLAEEVIKPECADEINQTYTFYKLATIKGYVDIRWYGTSNGYYSETVDFLKK